MRIPLQRRWMLQKFDRITGRVVDENAPAPLRRLFWTYRTANRELARLNQALAMLGRRERFRLIER